MAASCPLKLPAFLELRQTPNRGRGIFTTKRIYCGEEILRCKPYTVGVCATSAEGLKEMCHFCLKDIPTGSAVMCDRCNAVAYCTTACRDEALRMHRVECEGLLYLEGERGKENRKYTTFSESTLNYWPPAIAVAAARALNRRVMDGKSEHEWEFGMISKPDVSSIRGVGSTKHIKEIAFKQLLPYMWKLILTSITTEEMIHDAYWRVAVNASGTSTRNANAIAVFIEFSLLNHCCVPNCMHSIEDGVLVVSAVRDIKAGQELCISYIRNVHRILPGAWRREKLTEVHGFECTCQVCTKEHEIGSKIWKLEQQKKLFMAPWSQEMADNAMKEGRSTLMKMIQLQENGDWAKIVKEAETAFNKHKKILDEKNAVIYLLSRALLQAYYEIRQFEKALKFARLVMKTSEEYEFSIFLKRILNEISTCHYNLGNIRMGQTLANRAITLFPPKVTQQ